MINQHLLQHFLGRKHSQGYFALKEAAVWSASAALGSPCAATSDGLPSRSDLRKLQFESECQCDELAQTLLV